MLLTFVRFSDDPRLNVSRCISQKTLTINQAVGGTIAASPEGPYHYGDDVTLTATPEVGYTFSGWTDDLAGETTARSSCTWTGTRRLAPALS